MYTYIRNQKCAMRSTLFNNSEKYVDPVVKIIALHSVAAPAHSVAITVA